MGRNQSEKTKYEESRMEVMSLSDTLIDMCDELDTINTQCLSGDLRDNEPRKKAVRGADDLHRGLYGNLPDRAHAQLTFILQQITENERIDKENEALRLSEKAKIQEIQKVAQQIRDEFRGKKAL